MIRGNTSDLIGHPLPKDYISDPHMGPPTTPGPRAPHHLNPALRVTDFITTGGIPSHQCFEHRRSQGRGGSSQ